ncbi:MAG: hypothetical protein A3I04_02040 [Nitrospinae bacterium RIFCSPLOWO2_02_FULL_39_110]|nr:MAG: hypothetical protein A2W53_07160 [Nitrospinae bacterium RIFCSPHIGHO2_02_39_11]OGW00063.1 MAG: hypothetical protein A3D97_03195 [Nitrospinae bacterium RIFCSPHIGHO2_12_FULL_39_42]OGW01466.1 MAG: hypothetical protein A3D20_00770 [Nitrospinae bacterium RIFCSPHIGHO2_02_FULL_39_82]OGW03626.1 MAG: hypothetical protein A2Z59_05045 [Nitrospinae bacterium RIFCSPLOWO2_02_39_17]OGW05843.1 MAG: hypothetical protein A3I04_02040 [Nitrospinae bacterium RIFCSPLOWO2_02_FULL_39_110]OGW09791.1 MAG: hypoth
MRHEARDKRQEAGKILYLTAYIWFLSCFLLLASCFYSEARAQDICISCHKEMEEERLKLPTVEWEASIHKIEKVRCHNCHGGDPESGHGVGFMGKPARKDIPKFCGRCHIRQLNNYQKSKHEKLLSERKEEGGATCVDCHGYHKIKGVKDTESPVYYLNVPETCSRCHSDSVRMKQFKIPTNQLELYKEGKHGLALYGRMPEVRKTSAPNCAVCHGHHDPMISAHQDIPRICGKCHPSTFDNFKKSLHFDALKKSGDPSCAYCHGNHKVIKPAGEIFSNFKKGECGECHDQSSKEFKVGLNIKKIIKEIDDLRNEAIGSIEEVKNYGRNTGDLEQLYNELNGNILMIAPVTHSLDLDKINEYVNKITKTSQEVKGKVEEFKKEISRRYMVYAVSMIMIFTAVIILSMQLYIYKRTEK